MSPFDGALPTLETAPVAGVRKKKYTKAPELVAAMREWASQLLPDYYSSTEGVAELRAATSGIPSTDRKLEARAKKIWDKALSSLSEVVAFAEQNPRGNLGYAFAVRHLDGVLAPRGFDTLRAAVHLLAQFPRNLDTKPSRGWTPLTHLVFEVGDPRPAPERKEGWELRTGGPWRFDEEHELSLDELVAFAVLAGFYTDQEARQTITQSRRQKSKTSGALLSDGIDYVRKAVRERLKFLTVARARA